MMALSWLSLGTKYLLENHKYVRFFYPLFQKSTRIDAIDCFTTDLVEKKKLKWEIVRKHVINKRFQDLYLTGTTFTTVLAKTVLQDLNEIKSPEIDLNINHLSSAQLDNILITTLETKHYTDFFSIISQCLSKKKLPSDATIIECLKYLSLSGHTNLITEITELLIEKESSILSKYNHLLAFKGLSLWKNGKLIIALKTLEKIYEYPEIKQSKKYINYVFEVISEETLCTKSEAVLVCLLKTAEQFYKLHEDIFLLTCVWRNCFQSKWFSDQQLADKIFDDFSELRHLIEKRSWSLSIQILRNYEVDLVHRFIELFLKYEMKNGYRNCLNVLFDYHYYRRDLRACNEIVKTCSELNLPLTNFQNEKLLNLLLSDRPVYVKRQRPDHRFVYKF